MNKDILNRIKTQLDESTRVRDDFFAHSTEQVVAASELIGKTLKSGGRVLVCGNGGSAADSQHFACEMLGRFLKERAALSVVALSTDTSTLTAIGNDYGYDFVFSRQVDGLGRAGDLLFAISTSGNSKNVLLAVESAQKKGMKVLGLTGGSGGKLAGLADLNLNVALGKNSPRIQETHILAIHLICDLVDEYFVS